MYFAGDGISSLTLEDRMTLTNMAIEAGGKNGICDVDEKTLTYVRNRSKVPTWEVVRDDADAQFHFEHEWDLATLEPLVAKPHSPDNRDTAYNCRDVKLDQAYIGSCTGGKITDMIFAANILKGNRVKIPTFVVPGSTEVHADMKRLNLRGVEKGPNEKSIEDVLLDAGCNVGSIGLRRLSGRPERHIRPSAAQRSLHQHDQPQFPRPHGQHQECGLSGVAPDGRRQRVDGLCHRSAGIRERTDRDRLSRGSVIGAKAGRHS